MILNVQNLHVPLSAFHLQQEQLIRNYPKTFENQEKALVERTEQIFAALLPVIETSINGMMTVLGDATPPTNPAQRNPRNSKSHPPFIPRYEINNYVQ